MNARDELERIGEDLRSLASDQGPVIMSARGGCKELLDDDDVILPRLAIWHYFNPLGPTSCVVSWVPLRNGDRLIGLLVDNPFHEEGVIYGLLPSELPEAAAHAALASLFAQNGVPEYLLLGGLPSSILHAENTPWIGGTNVPVLPKASTQSLFQEVFPLVAGSTRELRRQCDLFRRYRTDPWGRVEEERNDALQSLEAERPAGVVDDSEDRGPRLSLFDEWFDLVTDPDHVRAELDEYDNAWMGATQLPSAARLPPEAQEVIEDFARERLDALLEERLGPERFQELREIMGDDAGDEEPGNL